jgi:UDP-3-O-[3-hydroxymyristoyl] N-acetylglucosamine deacetylase/3-hydroxyacyl-[acyl-carrier-protein] dehydratase
MINSSLQKTLANEVNLKGVGLHTGKEVNLTFKPAPVNTGFIFVRNDLVPSVEIAADIQYVINTDRGTNLEKNGVSIQTSEHVLAALVGMSVNNCYIELDAAESPIMDGSSKFFC